MCVAVVEGEENMATAKSREVELCKFVLKAELSDAKYLPVFSSMSVVFNPMPSQL